MCILLCMQIQGEAKHWVGGCGGLSPKAPLVSTPCTVLCVTVQNLSYLWVWPDSDWSAAGQSYTGCRYTMKRSSEAKGEFVFLLKLMQIDRNIAAHVTVLALVCSALP